jgi:hypothetical protein
MSGAPQIAVVRTAAAPVALKASPKWPDVKDDYVVRYDGHLIGRIRLGGDTWEWSITVPMAMPVWANGTGESRDACMKDSRSPGEGFYRRPVPNALSGLGNWSERLRHANKVRE